ncbi:MAG: sigma 54-interacting transcriptional regulator [Deltaproteobacteria bacterium]|nr:sigma 54-interacting transcriptional regulator [Deltaproteobacteria bacterium]
MTIPKSPTRIINPEASIVRQSGRGRFIVLHGQDRGESFALDKSPLTLGSGSECQIQLTDPTVSRRHMEIRLGEGGLLLRDLGSTNGSFLKGARFRELELGYGTEIQVGQTIIKYVPDEQAVDVAPGDKERFGSLFGRDPKMRRLFSLLEDVAQTDATVLLEGETGSGKERFAEEIHRHSHRNKQSLVVFDCAAVPHELIESALFGHVKGAFTGAISERRGAFGEADGGTLFLDEIGELHLDLQPTLLRVLDKQMVRPVGGDAYRKVNVRVVAATNRDLRAEVAEKRFREDLYYRLAVVRITIPPLRDRLEDVPLLAQHFIKELSRGRSLRARTHDLEQLKQYPWPGNVRELRNLIERVVALSRDDELDFTKTFGDGSPSSTPTPAHVPFDLPFKEAKAVMVEAFEREYLAHLLEAHKGNLSAASRAAELDRKHLRELLRKHGLRDPEA